MRLFLLFLLSAIICLAPEWGPYYVQLFSGDDLRVVGPLENFKESCPASPRGESVCKVQYRIPKDQLPAQDSRTAVGLGVVIHATEVFCSDDMALKASFGDVKTAGKTLELLNLYQVVQIGKLECNSDLIVRAWAPESYRRFGAIGSQVVVGDVAYVQRVKAFSEFFRTPFLIFLTALFFGVFSFNKILSRLMQLNDRPTAIEAYSYAWVGFAFTSSGMANTFIPILSDSFVITRLSNFFGVIALAGPGMLAIARSHHGPGLMVRIARFLTKHEERPGGVSILNLIILAAVITPVFAKGLAPLCLVISVITLSSAFLGRSRLLLFLGLAGLSDSLKMLMVPYLPTSYWFMVFSLFCIIDSFVHRVRRSAGLVSLLKWTRDQIESNQELKSISEVVKEFADQFQINQISLIVTKPSGGCEIAVQSKNSAGWSSSKFFKDKLPPMFAHVLTTRDPLWHVQEDSMLAINLRKGEAPAQKYSGRYFSIIPLIKDSLPVGALAMTGYSERLAKDEFLKLKLNSVVNLLFPFLAGSIAHSSIAERQGWADKSAKLSSAILGHKTLLESKGSLNDVLQEVAQVINQHLQIGVYIGCLDPNSRRIHIGGIAGYPEKVTALYKDAQFYAVSHNEQGPLALAVSRRRPVTVGDVKWLASVLHPMTLKIFDQAKTQSCAAVPIFDQNDEDISANENVWGVLWLESTNVGAFLPQTETGLLSIAQAIGTIVSHKKILDVHSKTKQALAGFVPAKVLDKVMRGESARQEEVGYLLMADIRDSTKISRAVGADKWGEFTKLLAGPAEEIGERYGYSLQSIIWDALYFTKAAPLSDLEYQRVTKFAEEINGLINFVAEHFFGSIISESKTRARFCLTYGDITRDIRSSLNNNWTIVGTAMAAISKLEQVCKDVSGWLFIAESTYQSEPATNWTMLNKRVPGTNEKIYSYSRALIYRMPSEEIQNKVSVSFPKRRFEAA